MRSMCLAVAKNLQEGGLWGPPREFIQLSMILLVLGTFERTQTPTKITLVSRESRKIVLKLGPPSSGSIFEMLMGGHECCDDKKCSPRARPAPNLQVLPDPRFINPGFGRSAGSTELAQPHFKNIQFGPLFYLAKRTRKRRQPTQKNQPPQKNQLKTVAQTVCSNFFCLLQMP